MSSKIKLIETSNEQNVLRIGGKSLLPNEIIWPVNPNGEKLTLIVSFPTNLINSILQSNYPEDKIVSVFTTYSTDSYFLDSIVYNGDVEELDIIKQGYTKVILHSIGSPRNDSEFLIPAMKIVFGEEIDEATDYYGSLIGTTPVFIQKKTLELGSYKFCMQIYGGDFPSEFQDIFYLNDSIGYLFLNKLETTDDIGLFFTQCS
ncbi:MAG: DUF1963 domain-containing protein [Clostridiales bacterium]|nr:DUF1963 domain-containing protein [Clostridiales bacterium]